MKDKTEQEKIKKDLVKDFRKLIMKAVTRRMTQEDFDSLKQKFIDHHNKYGWTKESEEQLEKIEKIGKLM